MNTPEKTPMHAPSPEFRASLEREIVRALRESQVELPPSITVLRRRRWRTAITLGLGMVLGVGTQFASAQVDQARQQSELERVKSVERDVAGLRLQLARAQLEQSVSSMNAGVGTSEAVNEARGLVRAAEVALVRLDLDLAEIRVTAKAPRDELWAPLVGSRDFVKERLTLVASEAQRRLGDADGIADELQRQAAVGSILASRLAAFEADRGALKQEFERLALRLMLREQFFRDRLAPEEVARRAERADVTADLRATFLRLESAARRMELAKQRHATGTGVLLDVKRAELEKLELAVEVERLQERLKALGGGRPE